jgi:hypothetical protein
MQTLKLRLEAELEKGDQVTSALAVAEALESAAAKIRANLTWMSEDILDVPRGRLVYAVTPRKA